jgi:hypothetical protein
VARKAEGSVGVIAGGIVCNLGGGWVCIKVGVREGKRGKEEIDDVRWDRVRLPQR